VASKAKPELPVELNPMHEGQIMDLSPVFSILNSVIFSLDKLDDCYADPGFNNQNHDCGIQEEMTVKIF